MMIWRVLQINVYSNLTCPTWKQDQFLSLFEFCYIFSLIESTSANFINMITKPEITV